VSRRGGSGSCLRTLERRQLPPDWCLQPGEPASLLPDRFAVISQAGVGPAPSTRRRLLARSAG